MQEALEQWKQMAWARESGIGEQEFPAGALYIVGLPIGNAADITIRALWTLAIADCVAAEDTRQTQKILSRYGITTHEISVREFNEVTGAQTIIERLKNGERVALVTDAGTPAVSDPGALVVKIVLDAGFRVIPVPGASAVITALSASGLTAKTFTFVGFVPPQAKARRESDMLGRPCYVGTAVKHSPATRPAATRSCSMRRLTAFRRSSVILARPLSRGVAWLWRAKSRSALNPLRRSRQVTSRPGRTRMSPGANTRS